MATGVYFRVPGSEFPRVPQMLFHVSDTSGPFNILGQPTPAAEFYQRRSLRGFFEN